MREQGLKHSATEMGLEVWKSEAMPKMTNLSCETWMYSYESLQPPAGVLSPKPQTGTFAALLGSILKPDIEPDPEHDFLFVVQVCCCVIQLVQLPLYY